MVRCLWVIILLGGCVESDVVDCGDYACPAGAACDLAHHGCVQPDQLTSCIGMANNATCSVAGEPGGVCDAEVCIIPRCGDGLVQGAEQCDGDNLNGENDCRRLDYYEQGALGCKADCTFDKTGCAHICGDGVVDMGEDCDGGDLNGTTDCMQLDFYNSGPVGCTSVCRFDVAACTGECGDDVVQSPIEACEDSLGWTDARACVDFGFDAGSVRCARCGPSLADCRSIFGQLAYTTDGFVTAMHGRSANDVYFGAGSYVLHFDGTSWTNTDVTNIIGGSVIRGVWATATSDAWVTSDTGIGRWNGSSWIPVTHGTAALFHAIWGSDVAGEAWAVGDSGVIIDITGTTGTLVQPTPTAQPLYSVWGSGPSDIWAVGANGVIAHYNGAWATDTSPVGTTLWSVYGLSATDVWAVGDAQSDGTSTVLHKGTGGWTRIPGPRGVDEFGSEKRLQLTRVWASGPNDVWVSYTNPDALISERGLFRYDGATWTPVTMALDAGGGYAADARNVWVHQDLEGQNPRSQIMRLGGGSYGEWTQSVDYRIHAVWATGETTFAATQGTSFIASGIGIFENRAGVWEATTVAEDHFAFWGTSDTNLWASGEQGVISYYNGSSWSTSTTLTGAPDLFTVWGSGPSDVWVAGGARPGPGAVFAHYNGFTWTPLSGAGLPEVRAMSGSASNHIWATTIEDKLLRYNGSWSVGYTTPGWIGTDIYVAGTNAIWVIDTEGNLHHHDGTTWTQVPLDVAVQAIEGTSATDVFVIGFGGMRHWDGVEWSPIRTRTILDHRNALFVSPRRIRFSMESLGGQELVHLIERAVAWECTATEGACGDRVDNDCDGTIDTGDTDCP